MSLSRTAPSQGTEHTHTLEQLFHLYGTGLWEGQSAQGSKASLESQPRHWESPTNYKKYPEHQKIVFLKSQCILQVWCQRGTSLIVQTIQTLGTSDQDLSCIWLLGTVSSVSPCFSIYSFMILNYCSATIFQKSHKHPIPCLLKHLY